MGLPFLSLSWEIERKIKEIQQMGDFIPFHHSMASLRSERTLLKDFYLEKTAHFN